jgi:hypothetical protein
MKTLTREEIKKLRAKKNSLAVAPIPKPEPPVTVKKFDSLIPFLKTVSDLLIKIRDGIDNIHNFQSSEFNKSRDHQDRIKNELIRNFPQYPDDSARQWNFKVKRDKAGRVSDIEATRIE